MPRVTGRFVQNCSPDTIFYLSKKIEPHFFVDRSMFPSYDQEGLPVNGALYRVVFKGTTQRVPGRRRGADAGVHTLPPRATCVTYGTKCCRAATRPINGRMSVFFCLPRLFLACRLRKRGCTRPAERGLFFRARPCSFRGAGAADRAAGRQRA